MKHYNDLISDLKAKNFKPVYFLTGEEPYYIDAISEYILQNILSESEKAFNQSVLYGRDISIDQLLNMAKRYPMMADKQVIVVKEAQELSSSIEKLVPYVENPQKGTLLVLCYKYKALDKRKSLYKAISKNGVWFESAKLYENQVGPWIKAMLSADGYTIDAKSQQMLVDFLGTDLSRIKNELEKIQIIIPKGSEITSELIEKHIGISKEYNVFELRKAVGEKKFKKAMGIVKYFAQNPKDNPLVLTLSSIFTFFLQLMKYHGLEDHSPSNVSKLLGVHPFFVSEYQLAARNYPMKKVSAMLAHIREADLKSKGVGALQIGHEDLLKELIVKIMLT